MLGFFLLKIMEIKLRYLKLEDEEQFLKAMNQKWEENFVFAHYWESLANCDFAKYVEISPKWAQGVGLPEGHVSASGLFAFNRKNELVGRTSIRHFLNEELLNVGGHIGYGVVPSHRRKGYATLILKESLIWMKENLPEIDRVLVTCDEGNIGSQKTIEKNGGVLEDIRLAGIIKKRRYWITNLVK